MLVAAILLISALVWFGCCVVGSVDSNHSNWYVPMHFFLALALQAFAGVWRVISF